MRCTIRWQPFRQARPEQLRERRLARALRAAREVPYYQSRLSQLNDWRDTPLLPIGDFLGDPVAFYRHSPVRRSPAVQVPLADSGRVAVLGTGFQESGHVRLFRYDSPDELAEYRPGTIAGPMDRVRKLAHDLCIGKLTLPALERAVIVFTGLRDGMLGSGDRELLWRAFRVPVYEQFQGFNREPLAWECDAHDGLHVDTRNAVFESDPDGRLLLTGVGAGEYAFLRLATGFGAKLEDGTCGCGWTGPRLLGLHSIN